MYKGAIIGFGKIARTNHLEAYKSSELKEIAQITAVVEPNELNLEKSKEEFPELRFYSAIEKLFENEKVDFVDITAPPNQHYEILEKCISKNVHIVCEKPFTIFPSEAEKIKKMLLGSDVVFIPCHQYKYSPVWQGFKNYIDMIEYRSKVLVQFNVFRTEADPGLKQISHKWRTGTKDLGGGILADTGVHYLYLSSWMLGKIDRVSARLLNLGHEVFESEDTAVIILEGERGIAQITLTWAADKRFNSSSVISSNSSMNYNGGTNLLINTNMGVQEVSVPDMSDKINYTSMYVSLLTDFLNAVKNNKRNDEWIEEAYQSVCLMNKCYTSSKEEKTIQTNNEK
jgi:predicted dehydrogenase